MIIVALAACLAAPPKPHAQSPFLRSAERFPVHVQVAALLATVRITSGEPGSPQIETDCGLFGGLFRRRQRYQPGPWIQPQPRRGWTSGTGVIVGTEPGYFWVLTASHCVSDGGPVAVHLIWRDGKSHPGKSWAPKQLVARIRSDDVALLKIKRDGPVPGALPIRPDLFEPPAPVLSLGCDNAEYPWMWEGNIIGTQADSWVTDVQPWHGRSGGPLIDQQGYVVGICSAYSGNRGVFCHLKHLHRACDMAGVSWLYGAERQPEPEPPCPGPVCPQRR